MKNRALCNRTKRAQSFSGIYLFQILKTGLIFALYYNDRKEGERINKEKRNNKQFETTASASTRATRLGHPRMCFAENSDEETAV